MNAFGQIPNKFKTGSCCREVACRDYSYRSRVLEGLGVRPWINARNRSTLIEEDSDRDGNSFSEDFDDGALTGL